MGGRVSCFQLGVDVDTNKAPIEIIYGDIISLYPYILLYCDFPIGAPRICRNRAELQNLRIGEFFGIVNLTLLPPRNIPILPIPYRSKDAGLVFPACRTCADILADSPFCAHKDEQRAFINTTLTTVEVELALEVGYQILGGINEAWIWDRHDTSLFRRYLLNYVRLKTVSSGWPADVQSVEEREEYLKQINDEYSFEKPILEDEICKNGGKRLVAKLAMNMFWVRLIIVGVVI